jgi:hypothetical protein
MRILAAFFLLASAVLMIGGCGTGEVSNADQASKMRALHSAEQESRAKDGVHSE